VGADPAGRLDAVAAGSFVVPELVDPASFVGWADVERLLGAPGVRGNLNRDSRRIHDAPLATVAGSLAAGETLQLQDTERGCARLALLCAELQRRVAEGPVGANLYLSAQPGQAGLRPHRDLVDAVVVQVLGEKCWTVWEPVDIPPGDLLAETFWDPGGSGGRVAVETVLGPGDVLFLRRGDPHGAVCVSGPSLHLTIGLHRRTGQDVLDLLAVIGRRQGRFAASPPAGPSRGGWLAGQLAEIAGWVDRLDPGELASGLDESGRARFDDAGGASVDGTLLGCWPQLRLTSGAIDGHDLVLASPSLLTGRVSPSLVRVGGEGGVPVTAIEGELATLLRSRGGRPITVDGLGAALDQSPVATARCLRRLAGEGLVLVQKGGPPCRS
jgi:hypothetical protein